MWWTTSTPPSKLCGVNKERTKFFLPPLPPLFPLSAFTRQSWFGRVLVLNHINFDKSRVFRSPTSLRSRGSLKIWALLNPCMKIMLCNSKNLVPDVAVQRLEHPDSYFFNYATPKFEMLCARRLISSVILMWWHIAPTD